LFGRRYLAEQTEKQIRATYNANLDLYKALRDEVEFEIKHALDQTDIKYHSVTARFKTVASLLGKVENRQIKDPFSEVRDIVGARVVTLFLSDIQKILDLLKETFEVDLVDNKIDDTDPRLFGYFSVHLHARIKATFSGTRYDKIKTIPFEIQIRTIAMDAWASASHYLAYKSDADVPSDLKRDFNALSGLYYVADKHFEMFFRSRAANLKRIDRAIKRQDSSINSSFDLDTLIAFLKDRYPDREPPDAPDASDLLSELRRLGINDFADLSNRLSKSEQVFLRRERINPPSTDEPGIPRFTATGAVRVSLEDLYKQKSIYPWSKSEP
jgi:ppGpp synthetase/RelA/SpoT-type nucleotidyltranferase